MLMTYEDEMAPAMTAGSAFASSSTSIVAIGLSFLCYVLAVCMH